MQESKVDNRIDHLKPIMKTLRSLKTLRIISGRTVVSAKVDGEFTLVTFEEGQSFTLNRWGHQRSNFAALNEFTEAMKRNNLKKVEALCELYAMEDGKPLKLPQFLHYIKSRDLSLIEKVHLGLWDLLSVDGRKIVENYAWRLEEASKWLNGCKLAQVLPYIIPKTLEEAEEFWKRFVEEQHYEGIVARSNNEIFKLKPVKEVDAVIIGINKVSDLFAQKQVTSIKVALMEEDGTFVELCDCGSGIDVPLRSALWKLMEYKVAEDSKCVFIKPMFVCQIEYTDTFQSVNSKLRFDGNNYHSVGTREFVGLKSPRLMRFRDDKEVSPKNLRLEQIAYFLGDYYWKRQLRA